MSSNSYKVIGTRPIRHDGIDKVTGRALYGADVQMAGLLHGRIVRSPHAHARIRKIDVSKALALPGVEAVATSADLPDPGNKVADRLAANATPEAYFLDANNKLLYHGRIDDSKDAARVKANDLRDALDAALAGKTIAKPTAKAFGCTIKRV